MFCLKCGARLTEDSLFCSKCGTQLVPAKSDQLTQTESKRAFATVDTKILKCPSCGAPISPLFGEMVITCEYCGSSITLGTEGWKSINKHSMLVLKVTGQEEVSRTIHNEMNRGLLRIRIHERSKLKQMNLTYVPFWIVSVSARTTVIAMDTAAEVGSAAATAALLGVVASGGRRSGGLVEGALLGSAMSRGMTGSGVKKSFQMNENYNYPVVAMKALTEYQPHDFEFDLKDRILFDASKVPTGIKIINGDISEDDAKNMARTLVDQLQSRNAHEKYHMIQHIATEIDVGEAELLHVPVWAAEYEFKGRKLVMVIDGNSGSLIHSVGLD